MSDAATSFEEALGQKVPPDLRHHDRSTIEFPYLDLNSALEVARALYARAGHSSCDLDELSAAMGQTLSGAFRMKTAAARLFGFVERDGRGKLCLTKLGQMAVVADTEAEARATGFLNVPLYRAIYDKYRGHLLPPSKALEREMGVAGVAPKQTDKARQAFERSARQAGFYSQGEDRLVQPRFDRELPQTRGFNEAPDHGRAELDTGHSGGGGAGVSSSQKSVSEVLLAAFDPREMDETQQDAVWTLLKYFKSKGS